MVIFIGRIFSGKLNKFSKIVTNRKKRLLKDITNRNTIDYDFKRHYAKHDFKCVRNYTRGEHCEGFWKIFQRIKNRIKFLINRNG